MCRDSGGEDCVIGDVLVELMLHVTHILSDS